MGSKHKIKDCAVHCDGTTWVNIQGEKDWGKPKNSFHTVLYYIVIYIP